MKKLRIFQPYFKLVYLFLWGLLISGLHNFTWLIALNLGAVSLFLALIFSTKKSLFTYFKRWFALLIFIVLIWATLTWRIGQNGIELNPQGIDLAQTLSLRMNLLLFSLWIFLWDINDAILVQALGKLSLPEKLIQLFVLTVRYIALLGELRQKIDMAMRARGFRAGFNRRTFYVTAQSVALLLIHAMLKAEMAQIVLKCRGFQFGKKKREEDVSR